MAEQQQHDQQRQQQQDGGRRGEINHEGGPSKDGHLNPQIDAEDGDDAGRQIAQDRQQSSGSGMGQS